MLYANASAAVPIVANINLATAETSTIGAFTTNAASVGTLVMMVNDPVQGPLSYSLPQGVSLSVSESATIFNALFTIFNNRLTNYNSQLTALAG
jgi:hypothetical protein